jgi:hypothetical protein
MNKGIVHIIKSPRYWPVFFCLFSSFSAFAHGADDHQGLTWPPDPRGITNVVVHSDTSQESRLLSTESSRMTTLQDKVKNEPRAKQALGNNYTPIGVIDKKDKKTGQTTSKMVFFSRDKNATVEVEFGANNNVSAVSSTPANQYQPEITDQESQEAIDLARNYFIKKGISKVSTLKGYSIMAYEPQGKGFYSTRVIYVSFHDNDDSPPELSAWVDLSRQKILKTREEE